MIDNSLSTRLSQPFATQAVFLLYMQATYSTFAGRGIKEKLQNGYNRPELKARSKKDKKKIKQEKKTNSKGTFHI